MLGEHVDDDAGHQRRNERREHQSTDELVLPRLDRVDLLHERLVPLVVSLLRDEVPAFLRAVAGV